MYNHGGVLGTGAATGATLPFTGLNTMWLVLAAFALLAVGTAILRLVPRREA
ncbi:MAG TPA: hypothetical protein VHE57_06770 [Mycobacteriales bacterium]|jgi:hypothetical protein|nr:hypothetical protein [Mycobacteriales bacterium]